MLMTYTDCLKWFKTKYNIGKQVAEGNLFKLEKGIYSDKAYAPEYQIISVKYPNAVFTMDSAFYYHNLTDVIPEKYYLMTGRGSSKIRDKRVVQSFENSNALYLGAEYIDYNGVRLRMYNKERMLLELLRNKNKLPFDYYKEVIRNYRRIMYELDMQSIQEMMLSLPKSGMIIELLETEVL